MNRLSAAAALAAVGFSTLPAMSLAAECPAQPADVIHAWTGRMDAYFGDPQSPVVYRALAGQGDPQIEALNSWESPNWTPEDIGYLARLFPDQAKGEDTSWATYGVGACRLGEALSILKERTNELGDNNPYLLQWIAAQRVVFGACTPQGPNAAALPPALRLGDPAQARMQAEDRAYQQASLDFYSARPLVALAGFQRIAASRSPYRPVARYMVVAIRAGSRGTDGAPDKPLTTPAESLREVQALIADPAMESVRPIAEQLVGWLAYNNGDAASGRAEVQAVLKGLEAPLATLANDAEARDRYARALADIADIHAGFPDAAAYVDGATPDGFPESRAMADAAKTDPLAAWVVFPVSVFQARPWALHDGSGLPDALSDDLDKRAGDNAEDAANPWAHEALMNATAYDAARWAWIDDELKRAQTCGDDAALAALPPDFYHQVRTALIAATDDGTPDEAAFAVATDRLQTFPLKDADFYTATVHDALQYLMAEGRVGDARRLRDRLALDRKATAPTATNSPNDLLAILAEDEDHLVRTLTPNAYEEPALLNRLPIAELEHLARRTDVPPEDRAIFARTAWTRAYALSRPVPPSLDTLMRSQNPDVVKAWRSPAGKPVRPDDHVALMDVLASPALNLPIGDDSRRSDSMDTGLVALVSGNDNDDNWWCSWDEQRSQDQADDAVFQALYGYGDETEDQRRQLRALTAASFLYRAGDPSELLALSRVEQAPQLLTERTIAWVEHSGVFGSRDGQAEALALAVRTTRWGCNWQGRHGPYSHKAYLLLHSLFPTSDAAKATKYWFDCVRPCPAPDPAVPPVSAVVMSSKPRRKRRSARGERRREAAEAEKITKSDFGQALFDGKGHPRVGF